MTGSAVSMEVPARDESSIDRLAAYAASLSWAALPPDVRAKAKMLVRDSVACAIGGSRLTASRTIVDICAGWGGRADAQVMGTNRRLPAAWAAYANGFLANALDFDDTYLVIGHPGAAIVPAAFAVGEAAGSSGAEVLAGVVAAYEVSCRIGYAITATLERMDQVFGLPTWHSWAAAAAAARTQGFCASMTADALALSGPHAMVPHVRKYGLEDRPVASIKNNMGWCALGGVLAAEQARRGFRGNRTFLDGERGFWVMSGSDRCDFAALTAGLGSSWRLLDVSYKPYPVCRYIHVAIDALREALAGRSVRPSDVARVKVWITSNAVRDLAVARPHDMVDAQYSIPFAVAAELTGLPPGPAWFDDRLLTDPQFGRLCDLVEVLADPAADAAFREQRMICRIAVETRDGAALDASRGHPKGDPLDPLSERDLERKFHDLCDPVIGKAKAGGLREALDRLDEIDDVGALAVLLRPDDASGPA